MTRYQISYHDALNDSQLAAVTQIDGPLLVIAGAGSGKTRTLTYRVAYLVENSVPPSAILLLTFTRKASQEMLLRASSLLDHRCEGVSGGTFHSFAYSLLRRFNAKIGLPDRFSIMDRADTESLIGMIRKETGAFAGSNRLPRKQTLANIFSKSVNKVLSIEDIVYDDYPHFMHEMPQIAGLQRTYTERKRQHGFLDYDDLLVFLLRLLADQPDIRRQIGDRFSYLMVDEYQDTNRIQAEILYHLTGTHQNIMVVGDDSQSIYAFRGANFRNIMDFPDMFPGTRIISLEENYRSIQPILDLTNVVIEQAAEKYSKRLYTRMPGGNKPRLVETPDENNQSRFVIEQIRRLRGTGISLKEIAVLFRAGFHSFDLEIELAREGISFVKVGGFKFMESAHIKDVLAHLRVLQNPNDRVNWYRILLLIDRIGPRTAEQIFNHIQKESAGHSGILSITMKPAWSGALGPLKELYAKIDATPMSLTDIGESVMNYYAPILRSRFDDHPKRFRDLEQLLAIMERYDNLEAFLTDMALEPPTTTFENSLAATPGAEDRLTLSTIHSAKGLEWDAVFVLWTLDGRFPSVHAFHHREDLEEELRLMYVAATRARNQLFFVYPTSAYDRATGMPLNRPSRFLEDIPEDILERQWFSAW